MKIHRNFRKQSAIVISLLAAAATLTSTAHAQMTCAISLEITKGGFVVGASGGRGVLNCAGKRYELEVSGLNAGLVIGMSRVSLRGTARNLQRVSDIEGTYSGVGASAAAGGGASNGGVGNGASNGGAANGGAGNGAGNGGAGNGGAGNGGTGNGGGNGGAGNGGPGR